MFVVFLQPALDEAQSRSTAPHLGSGKEQKCIVLMECGPSALGWQPDLCVRGCMHSRLFYPPLL